MFLRSLFSLFVLMLPAPQAATITLSAPELIDTARRLAHDEGWPIEQKGFTFDPMQPATEDSFYNIGLYREGHLLRMYSIHRQTGDIVDFMHGCDLIQFDDVKALQSRIRKASGQDSLPVAELAKQVGCPRLNLVNTRWIH